VKLFSDSEYLRLRSKFAEPNLFLILDNASYEIRHSSFLGWLIDPEESHGQDSYFLLQLLDSLGRKDFFYNESVQVKRELEQIDLLVYSKRAVLVIENKTRSKDSAGQLSRYRKTIEKKFPDHVKQFVYWTLNGDPPADSNESQYWHSYSYKEFLIILKRACLDVASLRTRRLIMDYVDALELGFLPSEEYVDIAKLVLARCSDELSDYFSNSPSLSSIDFATLNFIKRNSSFVKGNGFFSKDRPFVTAFINACKYSNYVLASRGEKQTTYFSFYPKDVFDYYVSKNGIDSIPFYCSFRFFHEKRKISLKFGLKPMTPYNYHDRQLILNAVHDFHLAGVGTPITKSGLNHVGILKLEIDFDPIALDYDRIDFEISRIFDEHVNPFVTELSQILMKLALRTGTLRLSN